MRNANIDRKTTETDISLSFNLDGSGQYQLNTGCGFFDHMLQLFTAHGKFDLSVECTGDTHVDFHHTIEDIGISLGNALSQALSDKRGITRYGSVLLPMDESLALVSIDISGRSFINFDVTMPQSRVGDFDTELVEEFFTSLARAASITLHIKLLEGKNTHHIIECIFKAFGRALQKACFIDKNVGGEIPSTKGLL